VRVEAQEKGKSCIKLGKRIKNLIVDKNRPVLLNIVKMHIIARTLHEL
jgi:hypothetical protein